MTRPQHLSTLVLHQYRYGELDGEALDRARAHLAGCDRCQQRLGVQQREREAFVLQPVPPAIREAAAAQAASEGTVGWRQWLPLGWALLAAAALFVIVPQVRTGMFGEPVGDTIRYRGELPDLEVWIDTGHGPRALRPGEVLGAGDRVQLLVDGKDAAYVTLAGVDASGTVEVYGGFRPSGGLQPAPFALTLDDSPRQAFFALTSAHPLDEATVKKAVRAGVLPGVDLTRVDVDKEAPR